MDPDTNLAEQLTIAAEINAIRDSIPAPEDAALVRQMERLSILSFRLAELVEALNTWICRGSFLPLGWGARCPDTGKHVKARA